MKIDRVIIRFEIISEINEIEQLKMLGSA
jgi:hypothetical protein